MGLLRYLRSVYVVIERIDTWHHILLLSARAVRVKMSLIMHGLVLHATNYRRALLQTRLVTPTLYEGRNSFTALLRLYWTTTVAAVPKLPGAPPTGRMVAPASGGSPLSVRTAIMGPSWKLSGRHSAVGQGGFAIAGVCDENFNTGLR